MNEAFHTSLHTAMKARAAEILPEVIELRRTIHKHPETGFDTGETEKLVKTFLEREHIAILPSELGVLGLIRGQNHDRMLIRVFVWPYCLYSEHCRLACLKIVFPRLLIAHWLFGCFLLRYTDPGEIRSVGLQIAKEMELVDFR